MSLDQVNQNVADETPINIMAWGGVVFAGIAAVLYGVLFWMLSRLPVSRMEFDAVTANAPVLTRLLVVGACAGLLNLVALVLCLAGWFLTPGSSITAVVGTIVSLLMFLAVFSVVIASLVVPPN